MWGDELDSFWRIYYLDSLLKYDQLGMEGSDSKLMNDNIIWRNCFFSYRHNHKSTSQLSSKSTPPGSFLRTLVNGKFTACFHNRLPCGKNVFRTLAFARDLIRFAMPKLDLCIFREGVFIYIFHSLQNQNNIQFLR